ncbi:LytR/AlgR family response regulator transcription factor [Arcticibacterium luteifluviistationis]|uniref:DNA-binding response regulator n=1 Tax=Arcticibacterium luteifluviistationis TaxID=1784714 RepID=A0A2Z4GBX6_9BACT|nr:LytTR family DNA-binding domain-containing protein [Arcticibacterium luteifluviistationis]AWV98568.1 DNA-binding response regulator [Arcticibacterium luteifluviistationis]
MKLRSIVVEDDILARKMLEHLCVKHESLEHLQSFESAEDALVFLETINVDLIWLDVEMGELNGFDLLKRLANPPSVIMTTSSSAYAFEAYQHDIVDYILKPINLDRFNSAVTKVMSLERHNPKENETADNDIFIKSDKKHIRLAIDDITYVENLSDYVKIYTKSNVHIVHATMKSLGEKLGDAFFRVHRSFLVNLNKVKDVDDNNLIAGGREIPISRRTKSEFLEKLNILK